MAVTPVDQHTGVILVSPTGAGKTTIASHIVEAAAAKDSKTLFLAHRKELIEQASARLDEHDLDHGIIKAGNKRVNDFPVQVASVHTIRQRLDKYSGFNLIVVDECHHTAAKSYLKIIEHFPGAIILGLTATPYRSDGRGLGGVYQSIVEASNPTELTRLGYLVPARVFTTPMLPNLTKIKTVAGDYDKEELGRRVDKPELVGDIYEHWNELGRGRPTVVFAASRNHAQHICDLFKSHGVSAEYLDGETPEGERTDILANLSHGTTEVVCNMGILTEGWDCPCVSCIVLARPTKSTGLYLQMAGRPLRPFPGKGDCIILDHGGNTHSHGLITDPRFFSLDAARKIKNEEPPVKTCKKCFAVFRGKTCPACGEMAAVERDTEDPQQRDGKLVEFSQSEKQVREKYYGKLVGIQHSNGYSSRWAAVQYKIRYGVWPPFKATGNIWRRKVI